MLPIWIVIVIDLGYVDSRMLPNMMISTVWDLSLQNDVVEPINNELTRY